MGNYEQKYKEALSRAKTVITLTSSDEAVGAAITIFPELRESEDENWRNWLIGHLKGYINQTDNKYAEVCKKAISWLEKQGEQKSVDKVESKFNIEKGKWYVCDTSRYTDFVVGKAYYCPKNEMLKPNENEIARYVAKDCFHLWTIQDAKDGDVIYHKCPLTGIEYIVMNKGVNGYGTVDSYFRYNSNDGFGINIPSVFSAKFNYITPATKEQRDLLFSKMHEAGYEWDSEKKELKKIEQRIWNEEDERIYKSIIDDTVQENQLCKEQIDWLKSLKDKVQPQQKQKWSEVNDSMIDGIKIAILNYYDKENAEEIISWLKSLKPQKYWKPTEEQVSALRYYLNLWGKTDDQLKYIKIYQNLESLYNDLKLL